MAIIISIALQKGGVGKSTTAQALASILGTKHNKVLLIDMDSQHNVTYSSGIDNPERSITDVLGEDCKIDDAIIPCKYYDILAADDYLSNVEMAEVKPTLLRDAINPLRNRYDFIIIDTKRKEKINKALLGKPAGFLLWNQRLEVKDEKKS